MPELTTSTPDLDAQKKDLDAKLAKRLAELALSRYVHLPPASASVNASRGLALAEASQSNDVSRMLDEYFTLGSGPAGGLLPTPEVLVECHRSHHLPVWSDCFTPGGRRGSVLGQSTILHGLFTADALWLFYMERMGLFELQGALVEDYAVKGKFGYSRHT